MCEELEIRCADGNTLPYLGYVAVLVDLPFLKSSQFVRPFRVVPIHGFAIYGVNR